MSDLFDAYEKYARSKNLKVEQLLFDHGHIVAKINGNNAGKIFWSENGQAVIQRIPPTENKGRKQTSYVVVSVLPLKIEYEYKPLLDKDLEITPVKLGGPGGQNRNKCQNGIRMKHIPSGIVVTIDGRDLQSNKYQARNILTARVNDMEREKVDSSYAAFRKSYIGSGGRGDKVRTYNVLENRCVDHRTGKKVNNIKAILEKGNFDLLK